MKRTNPVSMVLLTMVFLLANAVTAFAYRSVTPSDAVKEGGDAPLLYWDYVDVDSTLSISDYDDTGFAHPWDGTGVAPWLLDYADAIINVDITGKITPISTFGWFGGCVNLLTIDLTDLDVSKLTDASYMFYGCRSLEELSFEGFGRSPLQNVSNMFCGCESLEHIDFSDFNTIKVTDMSGMFRNCTSLTHLDITHFQTSKVTSYDQMFRGCESLTTVYAGNSWMVKTLATGSGMFDGCVSIKGELGTAYDPDETGLKYAHIDGDRDGAGYLSSKGIEAESHEDFAEAGPYEIKVRIENGIPGENVNFVRDGFTGWSTAKINEDGYAVKVYNLKANTDYIFNVLYKDYIKTVKVSTKQIVKRTYTILFIGGEGVTVNPSRVIVEEGKTVSEPKAPVRDGYTFAGWFTDPETTEQYDFNTPVTKRFTLYAKWTENKKPEPDPDPSPVIPVIPSNVTDTVKLFTGALGNPVTDGSWSYNENSGTWSYQAAAGRFIDTWGYIANPYTGNKPAWFYFDRNGSMLTGWHWIYWNGSFKCFYFHEASDGQKGECLINGITPDGYTVNENGAWTVNGIVQEQAQQEKR